LFKYHRAPILSSTVGVWDIRYSLRDQEKLFEIINTLHEWLRSDYSNFKAIMDGGGTHQWIGWFDNTTSFVGDTVNTSLPYGGVPCWNSDALGALEVATGKDLEFIRNPITGHRIGLEELDTIHLVLLELTDLFCVGWVLKRGLDQSYVYNVNPTRFVVSGLRNGWNGRSSTSLALAETNYINDTVNTQDLTGVRFINAGFEVKDSATYSVDQDNLVLRSQILAGSKGIRDSLGNLVSLGDAGAKSISSRLTSTGFGFPSYDYDELFLIDNNGVDVAVFSDAHPKAITGYTTGEETILGISNTLYIDTGLPAVSEYYTP
ncbi:hypothetical protein N9924_01115, partial [bacterium]|nr:hypothetical protein [bacterium]